MRLICVVLTTDLFLVYPILRLGCQNLRWLVKTQSSLYKRKLTFSRCMISSADDGLWRNSIGITVGFGQHPWRLELNPILRHLQELDDDDLLSAFIFIPLCADIKGPRRDCSIILSWVISHNHSDNLMTWSWQETKPCNVMWSTLKLIVLSRHALHGSRLFGRYLEASYKILGSSSATGTQTLAELEVPWDLPFSCRDKVEICPTALNSGSEFNRFSCTASQSWSCVPWPSSCNNQCIC